MSVVPMKLLTIAGPLERFDDVVRACVIDQEFHPENALQLMRSVKGLRFAIREGGRTVGSGVVIEIDE